MYRIFQETFPDKILPKDITLKQIIKIGWEMAEKWSDYQKLS